MSKNTEDSHLRGGTLQKQFEITGRDILEFDKFLECSEQVSIFNPLRVLNFPYSTFILFPPCISQSCVTSDKLVTK